MAENGMTLEGMCIDYLWYHCCYYKYSKTSMRTWLLARAFKTRQTNDIKQNKFYMCCLDIMNDRNKWIYVFKEWRGKP